jgi:hypothetical protein
VRAWAALVAWPALASHNCGLAWLEDSVPSRIAGRFGSWLNLESVQGPTGPC